MQFSYDYSELIAEIRAELEGGTLALSDTIQILRSLRPRFVNYRPIIDWYYSKDEMDSLLAPDFLDDEKDQEEKEALRIRYKRDKPFLESVTVSDCLAEMEKWNKVL